MKLNQKTFIYSLIISFVVGAILIIYMIFMVPSLYTDYKAFDYLQAVKENHQSFLNEDKFKGDEEKGAGNSIGFKLDKKTYKLDFSSYAFEGSLDLGNTEVKKIIQNMENEFSKFDVDNFDREIIEKNFENFFNQFIEILSARFKDTAESIKNDLNAKFHVYDDNIRFQNEKYKFYNFGKNFSVIQAGIENVNSNTEYLTYFAFSEKNDAYYISMANTVNPKPTEIQPVMIEALPVIIPMIILLSLAISTIFSKKIVSPIRELSNDAKKRQYDEYKDFNPIMVKGNDEIAELASSLNDLYLKQNESINKLESEAKRKEIFMRSFSHQLKTPVATASLLVDSMILKVGKFADKEKYLPEVKKELNSMKRILSEILEMNNISKSQKIERVDLYDLSLRIKNEHHFEISDNNLDFTIVNGAIWKTDGDIIYHIIDNLVKNAISYTKTNGKITVTLSDDKISVENMPATIEENIREVIFEPFVTGNIGESGHGLGLYLVKSFVDLLKMEIEVEEKSDTVKFIVYKRGRQ